MSICKLSSRISDGLCFRRIINGFVVFSFLSLVFGVNLFGADCGNTSNRTIKDVVVKPNPDWDTFIPPSRGESYCDEAFGTGISRYTDIGENNPNTGGAYINNGEILHWNRSGSYFYGEELGATFLYDRDGNKIRQLSGEGGFNIREWDIRWTNEDEWVYEIAGTTIDKVSVVDGTRQMIADLGANIAWGEEGDMSDDRRYASLTGSSGGDDYIFVYNFEDRRIEGINSITDGLRIEGNLDYHVVSPRGNYVVVAWKDAGSGRFQGIEVYDRSMNYIGHASFDTIHMDVGIDSVGDEVVFTKAGNKFRNEWGRNNIYDIVSIKLDNPDEAELLFREDRVNMGIVIAVPNSTVGNYENIYVGHFGKSYFSEDELDKFYAYEIIEVPVDGSQQIRRLVHNRSFRPECISRHMRTQPDMSIDWQGRRIIFKSSMIMNSVGSCSAGEDCCKGPDMFWFDIPPAGGAANQPPFSPELGYMEVE